MPQLDFDVITLGHGSGGFLTNKLLESGVFSLFDNEVLVQRHDGAWLESLGPMAFTTDSFVVSPIFFPGGNIGDLAINGTLNDLAMCGAIPKYLSVAFILEEGLRMQDFWQILVSMKILVDQAGVQIATGDTKVVEKGKGDQIFINTTGIGAVHPMASLGLQQIKVGDKIIVSGELARHGMAIMSVREGLEFETDILSDTTSLVRPVMALIETLGESVHLLRDATRGGVATVLAEITKSTRLGMDIRQKDFTVGNQVAGACELLGLDPLYVANEGVFVAFVHSAMAEKALEILNPFDSCKHAAIVGEVTESHAGQVVLESNIGGRRVVNMLAGEQLPRIC